MSDKNVSGVGTVRIFGCGGLGLNFAANYLKSQGGDGFAAIDPAFIDTSRSNLTPEIPEEKIYILDNTDGSGKVRRENHAQISSSIKHILQSQQPGEFNIVVFSASGGSGSVLGPLIVSELLARGLPVVVLTAGSSESNITANNTVNTLKSLAAISKKESAPVVTYYLHNGGDNTRSAVDKKLAFATSCLSYLASRQNAELDTKDVSHWLRYNHSTEVAPQLSLLDIFIDQKSAKSITDPISVASLYADRDQPHLTDPVPDYSATGYFQHKVQDIEEIHFVISTQHLGATYEKLEETRNDYNARRDSRVQTRKIVDLDEAQDDGLVL